MSASNLVPALRRAISGCDAHLNSEFLKSESPKLLEIDQDNRMKLKGCVSQALAPISCPKFVDVAQIDWQVRRHCTSSNNSFVYHACVSKQCILRDLTKSSALVHCGWKSNPPGLRLRSGFSFFG